MAEQQPPQRKEIYTYKAPWTVFSLAWSNRYVFVLLCNIVSVCILSSLLTSCVILLFNTSTTLLQNNVELIKTHNLD